MGWLNHYTVVCCSGGLFDIGDSDDGEVLKWSWIDRVWWTELYKSSKKASQSRRAMMRALPPSFFVLPQWQLRFIWHSGCIISVCLPLLAILVRRSQASWACALQRRVGDFVPVTGHWNRLDALTWQVNAELLITGLDVYYNPDSLRCKARPFMTSQHVFRDVFLGCRMWENIGMAWPTMEVGQLMTSA